MRPATAGTVVIEPISADAFAPFGDLLSVDGDPDKIINQGLCGRYHDAPALISAMAARV